MNSPLTDTCHCIVRHPQKDKFLVIMHAQGWAPPVLKFPSGSIDFKATQINHGMQTKYGLKTRVLRPILHFPNYHCIEMELVSEESTKKLQAVWADEAEYMKTRSDPGGLPDPFAQWFAEQAAKQVPEKRPEFHRPGWFNQAEHWMQFQLDKLGILVTGSVEQYRQGWTSSCVLRVKTNQGRVYFKAGNENGPGEAVLTAALAQRWPHIVAEPLAIDAARNWMLNRDFRAEQERPKAEQLPAFACALGQLQVESSNEIQKWQELGCPTLSLDDFVHSSQHPEEYREILQQGGKGLSNDEWEKFVEVLSRVPDTCRVLGEANLPLALIHTDFRDDNLAELGGRQLILDWSHAFISHPFLALGVVFRDHHQTMKQEGSQSTMQIDDELYKRIIESYLGAFSTLAGGRDLLPALAAAEQLEKFLIVLRFIRDLDTIEYNTPHFYEQVVDLQNFTRWYCQQDS